MFGVVFELNFTSDCFLNDKKFIAGEFAYFQILLEAPSMPEAYYKACEYSLEHYPNADVRVVTVSVVGNVIK